MSDRGLNELQREAERIQYSLRSTFFYRRRREIQSLARQVRRLDPSRYDWSSPEALGISETSWKYIERKGIPYTQVFCHPEVIRANPKLIAYYRCIALLPQKGVQRLAFSVKSLEEETSRKLSLERAATLAKLLNTYIDFLIHGDPNFSITSVLLAAHMNFGTQINGSWRNEIGTEGSRRVKELILKFFIDHQLAAHIISRQGTLQPPSPLSQVEEIQGFVALNGYKVLFGSEPDISMISPDGVLEGAIEVKAGIDPAGALERYGAAKKSFDRVLRENKSAATIYLASCVTEGVREAMADDRLVRKDFNLTSVFFDEQAQEDFFRYLCWVMHL